MPKYLSTERIIEARKRRLKTIDNLVNIDCINSTKDPTVLSFLPEIYTNPFYSWSLRNLYW